MSEKPISPLRQRMIEDMTVRKLGAATQLNYIRAVKTLSEFPAARGHRDGGDLRRFQVHQSGSGRPAVAHEQHGDGAAFLLQGDARPAGDGAPPHPRAPAAQLPNVLNEEEVVRRLEHASGVKYRAALGVAYGAGLRVSEVANLKVSDIDFKRMLIRVEEGKGRKDRNAMLSPRLLELLRDWWWVGRPSTWLFPGRDPLLPVTARQLYRVVEEAAVGRRDQDPRVAAHPAPQLRDTPPGAGRRHPRDLPRCNDPSGYRRTYTVLAELPAGVDLLREMIGFVANRMMDLEG